VSRNLGSGWAVARRVAGLAVAAGAGYLLVRQADRGVAAIRHGAVGPPGLGGPWWVVVLACVVLAAAGALPAWRLVGSRPLAIVLAPCLGSLVAALSAVVTVLVASEPLRWFVAFAAAVNAAAVASIAAPRDQQDHRRVGPAWSRTSAAFVGIVVLAVAAAGVAHSGIGPATRSSVRDRSTWLALAQVLVHGHGAVHRAVAGSPSTGAELLASPLAAGSVAVTWLVSGSRAGAAAVTVVAVVTLAAVATAGTAVAEVARTVTHGVGGSRISRPRAVTVQIAGLLAAATWILVAFAALAVSGTSVVDATVTLLWTSAATAAAAFGLVLPADRWRLRAVVLLGAVAALASPLGGLVAAALAITVTLRRIADGRHRSEGTGWITNLVGGLVALAAAAAWPVGAVVIGGVPLRLTGPVVTGGFAHGLDATWQVLQGLLQPAAAALVVCVVGFAVLGRWRSRHELGSDLAPAVVGVVPLAAVLVAGAWRAPVLGPWRVAASAGAAVYPLLLAGLVLSAWFVVGIAVATGAEGDRSTTTSSRVDGQASGALHPTP